MTGTDVTGSPIFLKFSTFPEIAELTIKYPFEVTVMLNMNKITDSVNTVEAYQSTTFVDEIPLGFISYPKNISLNIKHIWRLPELTLDEEKSGESELGLFFASQKHHKSGRLLK